MISAVIAFTISADHKGAEERGGGGGTATICCTSAHYADSLSYTITVN